jgi:Fanconi anemia group M protein
LEGSTNEEEKKVVIYADNREGRSKVLKALQGMGCGVVLKQLEAGDYIASERVGISVKASVSDFCHSLSGGDTAAPHLFDELHRLKEAYETAVLVVNGIFHYDFRNNQTFTYRPMWSGEQKRVINVKVNLHRPPASIIGAKAAVSRMGVSLLQTTSEYEAAQTIYRLARQEQVEEGRPLRIQKAKKAGLSLQEQQRMLVESLVGPKTAEALLTHFEIPLKMFTAGKEQLMAVEGVGEKTADEIARALTTKYKSIEKGEEKQKSGSKTREEEAGQEGGTRGTESFK